MIMVDNGSTDGSPGRVAQALPGVEIIAMGENAGLAHARNRGLAHAMAGGAGYVLFLDDDAWLGPDALARLVRVLEEAPEAGIVTPRILDARRRDRVWYDGGTASLLGGERHRSMGRTHRPPEPGPVGSAFATGCCMLVRRAVFERIGGFAEEFFVYCEDADFSFRARRWGFAVLHLSGAVAWHEQSGDTRANRGRWYRDYYVSRNTLLLRERHLCGWRRPAGRVATLARLVCVVLPYLLVTLQGKRVLGVLRGVAHGLQRRWGGVYR